MAEPLLGGMRVLVVEDEYLLAQEICRDLVEHGCTVLGPVPNIDRALDIVREQWPDAALLDVNLGGEMVYGLADVLLDNDVPFVFTTGYDPASLPGRFARVPVCEKPTNGTAALRSILELIRSQARVPNEQ